jgi:hypothetical protein
MDERVGGSDCAALFVVGGWLLFSMLVAQPRLINAVYVVSVRKVLQRQQAILKCVPPRPIGALADPSVFIPTVAYAV